MKEISYVEDKSSIAYCVENRNYEKINEIIDKNKAYCNYAIEIDNKFYGYKINKIKQLSNLYQNNYYSVTFSLKNNFNYFNEYDNANINVLIKKLMDEVLSKKGYYIIKVPSNFTTLINQFNNNMNNFIFAGGTVCYYTKNLNYKKFNEDNLVINQLGKYDVLSYKEKLKALGKESFKNYFGQYHISSITRDKAPIIYENWVEDYINAKPENIMIAEYNDKLAGFLIVDSDNESLEMVLSGVDERYKGNKIYERMIRHGVNMALNDNKIATTSTQFDNYLVQRAWVNMGFKPYYSFYLFHICNY